jgi:hypothetical protein
MAVSRMERGTIGVSDPTPDPMGRGRVIAVRVLAVVALVTACFLPVFATFDASSRVGEEQVLEPPGSPEAEYGATHPSEVVHIPSFVAMTVIAASGLLALIVNPRRAGSATQAMAVGLAMLSVAPIAGDPDNYGGQGMFVDPLVVAVAVPVLAAAALAAPWREWRRRGLKRQSLLWLGLLALPFVWYGIEQALLQRNTWPPLADPHHQTHWMVMAELAFAIPLVTAGASLSGRGWRIAGSVAALGVLAITVPSLIDGEAASSLQLWAAVSGALWAAAALTVIWRNQAEENPTQNN